MIVRRRHHPLSQRLFITSPSPVFPPFPSYTTLADFLVHLLLIIIFNIPAILACLYSLVYRYLISSTIICIKINIVFLSTYQVPTFVSNSISFIRIWWFYNHPRWVFKWAIWKKKWNRLVGSQEEAEVCLKCSSNIEVLEKLPQELILHVISFLSARDICRLGQTSKKYQCLCFKDIVWGRIIERDWAFVNGFLSQSWGNPPTIDSVLPSKSFVDPTLSISNVKKVRSEMKVASPKNPYPFSFQNMSFMELYKYYFHLWKVTYPWIMDKLDMAYGASFFLPAHLHLPVLNTEEKYLSTLQQYRKGYVGAVLNPSFVDAGINLYHLPLTPLKFVGFFMLPIFKLIRSWLSYRVHHSRTCLKALALDLSALSQQYALSFWSLDLFFFSTLACLIICILDEIAYELSNAVYICKVMSHGFLPLFLDRFASEQEIPTFIQLVVSFLQIVMTPLEVVFKLQVWMVPLCFARKKWFFIWGLSLLSCIFPGPCHFNNLIIHSETYSFPWLFHKDSFQSNHSVIESTLYDSITSPTFPNFNHNEGHPNLVINWAYGIMGIIESGFEGLMWGNKLSGFLIIYCIWLFVFFSQLFWVLFVSSYEEYNQIHHHTIFQLMDNPMEQYGDTSKYWIASWLSRIGKCLRALLILSTATVSLFWFFCD